MARPLFGMCSMPSTSSLKYLRMISKTKRGMTRKSKRSRSAAFKPKIFSSFSKKFFIALFYHGRENVLYMILAIDQGTTGSTVLVVDENGRVQGKHNQE